MDKWTFVAGDLVLVNFPVGKRLSQRSGTPPRHGYWPAKVVRKFSNSNRLVKCYATREETKVSIQTMVVYNKENVETYLAKTQVEKKSVLAQALNEIEADFVAKNRTADEINLSGEANRVTSVVKSARLLESNDIDNRLKNLWNLYVEKSVGKTYGMCHLERFIVDFVKEHKEVIQREETYRDLLLHVCSLEEAGILTTKEVKNIVECMAEESDKWKKGEEREVFKKDDLLNIPVDESTDSKSPLPIECPDFIDEITPNAFKYAIPVEISDNSSDEPTTQLNSPIAIGDIPATSPGSISDNLTVANENSVLKNATAEEVKMNLRVKSRKKSKTSSRKTIVARINKKRKSRSSSKVKNLPGMSTRGGSSSQSTDGSLPWLSSRRSRICSRDENESGVDRQTEESATTSRFETLLEEAVTSYEPRMFPLSEEEYKSMLDKETDTPVETECNEMLDKETDTPVETECNEMLDKETDTPVDTECNEMLAQESNMMQEVSKVIAPGTREAPEYKEMIARKTRTGLEYNKIEAQEIYNSPQETPKTPDCNNMEASDTPNAKESNNHDTPKAPVSSEMSGDISWVSEYKKMEAQDTPKALKHKKREAPKALECKILAPAPIGPMSPLQPTAIDTTSSMLSDRCIENLMCSSDDGTSAAALSSSPSQICFSEDGSSAALSDSPSQTQTSLLGEFKYDKNAPVLNIPPEVQTSLLGNATSTFTPETPALIPNATCSSIERKNRFSKARSPPSVSDSSTDAQTFLHGDTTQILTIDSPTCTKIFSEDGNCATVSSSPCDAQTSFLADATPILVIDYPELISDTTIKSRHNLHPDENSTEVPHFPSDTQANLMSGSMPAGKITNCSSILNYATSEAIIDNPTERINVANDISPVVMAECPLDDNTTSIAAKHCPPNCTKLLPINATANVVLDYLVDIPISLFNDPNQTTSMVNLVSPTTSSLNHPSQSTNKPIYPTQTTNVLNHPTQNPYLLDYPTPDAKLLNYPVQTTFLHRPTQTTDMLSNPTHKPTIVLNPTEAASRTGHPTNFNRLAPIEPSTAEDSSCGDLLEQWWFGPSLGTQLVPTDEHRRDEEAPVRRCGNGGNNNCSRAGGETMSGGITGNIDKNFNNKEIEAVKDDEIEVIGASGSGNFVEKVFSKSKRKCFVVGKLKTKNEAKRKRPNETQEINKKYFMYRENEENVLNVRSKESDVTTKQSSPGNPGYRSSYKINTDNLFKSLNSTDKERNGNKNTMKQFSMTVEMSSDSFARVSKEVPNFRVMSTQKH